MSSEKRSKKKGNASQHDAEMAFVPTKENKSVAKYLQSKLPRMEGKFCGQVVNIFIASVALDLLMQSHWAIKSETKTSNSTCLFPSRLAANNYMNDLLKKGLLRRGEKLRKIRKTPAVTKPVKGTTATPASESVDINEPIVKKSSSSSGSKSQKKSKTEGKKARMKLALHPDQLFTDSEDVYIWFFDPIHWWTYLLGGLVLIVILASCLFPLWPAPLRTGTYYLAMVSAGLFGCLMALGLLRLLIFSFIWCVTAGGIYLWLLPNLFADCGVLDSFKPIWTLERKTPSSSLSLPGSDNAASIKVAVNNDKNKKID